VNAETLQLDSCGCCEDVRVLTPLPIANLPGLQRIAYRAGTHGSFKESLEARLSGEAALRDLTTRDDDDPTIALLDSWATVLDVLTFYQERIANEAYLRTATELRSILELAREIGYELGPGAAAGTDLVFTLETATGSPDSIRLGMGVKVQSLPGQDELPQIFETVEEIEARPVWNALRARLTTPVTPALGTKEVFLRGVATNLRPGDLILFVGNERLGDKTSERWDVRRLTVVEPDRAHGITRVAWEERLGFQLSGHVIEPAQLNLKIYTLRQRAALFGNNAPDWLAMPLSVRQMYRSGTTDTNPGTDWPHLTMELVGESGGKTPSDDIFLDGLYPHIVAGSWLLLVRPDPQHVKRGYWELYQVVQAVEDSRTDFTLSAKTTRITLLGEFLRDRFNSELRQTVVYGQSEQLELVEAPLTDPVQGDEIDLREPIPRLPAGRLLVVSGKRARVAVKDGVTGLVLDAGPKKVGLNPGDVLEVSAPFAPQLDGSRIWTLDNLKGAQGTVNAPADAFVLAPVPDEAETLCESTQTGEPPSEDSEQTKLKLAISLANAYDRESFRIAANVAPATHGESKAEVLGSGDASASFQRFVLKEAPLTYVPAADPSGSATTLHVRVNDVLWKEVRALYGHGPRDRVYVAHAGADGKELIEFGDGQTGARLRTGSENVRAAYRVGLGLAGEVKADKLSLLLSPPLGVRSVTNPFPATGAADPETLDRARDHAPLTVLTFDRIVSLQDFENFAAAFAGVGKAQATWLWDGESRLVQLTVAADDGDPLEASSLTFQNLTSAIRASGDPRARVRVDPYEQLTFKLEANVLVEPEYEAAKVLTAVSAELLERFSFERREFGQSVAQSEVMAAIQLVEGVEGVELASLYLTGQTAVVNALLPALRARIDNGVIRAAQLLRVAPDGVKVNRA
jgi:Baseplate J-like protein